MMRVIYTGMMRRIEGLRGLAIVSLAAASFFAHGACASPTAPSVPDGAFKMNGTVRYYSLEGGFWAVRGEDGVTYNPVNGLASSFQRENLAVSMVAKVRSDLGGVHMVGPIVEVLSIETR